MLPIILQAVTFEGAETALVPLMIVALLLDSALVSIWYMVGSILGNSAAKASARSELYQIGGTALLAVLIVALLTTFSSAFYNILGSTKLLNPAVTNSICQNIMAGTKLTILGSNGVVMSGSQESGSTFPGFCNMVNPSQPQTATTRMDYPLAATGVIIANLTNQTMTNLDSSFVVDSFLGFLTNLAPEIRLCLGSIPALQCVTPIPNPAATLTVNIGASFAPFAGLDFIYKSLADYGTMITNAYTLFVAQLTFIVVFVFIWPYLIFIGLVLRATPFTRGVGGLLIAAAIGMVLFYPLIYSIEYLSLGNGLVQSNAATYGYNYITAIPGRGAVVCPGEANAIGGPAVPSCGSSSSLDTPGCSNSIVYSPVCFAPSGQVDKSVQPLCTDSVAPTCNYTVNFFVQPSIKDEALSYGCWPAFQHGQPAPLNSAEFVDITVLLVPFYSLVAPLISLAAVPNSIPTLWLPAMCKPDAALKTFQAMTQSFGVMGISAYLLPVLNLVITLSGILGVSGLLGGDTSLAGIAKLL